MVHKVLECFHATTALKPKSTGHAGIVLPKNSERLGGMWLVQSLESHAEQSGSCPFEPWPPPSLQQTMLSPLPLS